MFRPSRIDAAVLIALFAVAPAFGMAALAAPQSAPQPELSVPKRTFYAGYVQVADQGFRPFGGPDSDIDLSIRSEHGWMVGSAQLAFLNQAYYEKARRYDENAVTVTGYEIYRGYRRWFVVESMQLMQAEDPAVEAK